MSPTLMLVLAAVLLFAGLALLLILLFAPAAPSGATKGRVSRRLSLYSLTGTTVRQQREPLRLDRLVTRSAVGLAGRMVAARDAESDLAARLEAAGIPLKPAEWTLLHAGIAVVTAVLFAAVSGGLLLAAVIGLLLGSAAPLVYLVFATGRRRAAFLAQMPDTLQLIAGGLSAGYSLPQAVAGVVDQAPEPISGEFNRAVVDARLGVPLEDAMEQIAERMKSKDFSWVVMAVRIQREVGGNLAEVLTTVAETMRERQRLRRQVQVLSAEGRLSAVILALLPILFFLYLLVARYDYISKLWTDLYGVAALIVAGVLLTVGILVMRVMVRVEV